MTDESGSTENPHLARLTDRLNQEQLPGMPAVAARLNQLLCQDECEISDVVAVVESDSALAARLLRVTNSAAAGLRHPATTVERAVLLLGLKGVRNMAISLAMMHGVPRGRSGLFDQDLFWRDTVRRAVAARVFAAHAPGCDREEAYLGALLQDLALPILVLSLGPQYGLVLREWTRTRRPLYQIEAEQFGWNHMEVGAWLARKWQFDAGVVSMIAQHHADASGGAPDTSETFWVQLSALVPSTKAGDAQPLRRLCDAFSACKPELAETLNDDLARIDEEFEGVSEAFQIRRGWTLPLTNLYERMAAQA